MSIASMVTLQVVRTSFGFHLKEGMGSCSPPTPPHCAQTSSVIGSKIIFVTSNNINFNNPLKADDKLCAKSSHERPASISVRRLQ